MRPQLPAAVSADRVHLALREARPAGLTFQQLVAYTGLSPSQVRRGPTELRDIAAANKYQPLIWTSAEGYRFSSNPAECEAYERAIFRRILTEVGRLLTGTIAPHAALFPDDEWVRPVLEQLNGVRASLGLLVKARR
jgi:hypothetical protein